MRKKATAGETSRKVAEITTQAESLLLQGLDHERYMQAALLEAQKASNAGDVPVGCVIIDAEGEIIGSGYNRREVNQDPVAHAEIEALQAAAQTLGSWRLCGCTAYVTLEPCPMCAGALVNSRIGRVVYGCRDPKAGAIDSLFQLGKDERLNHRFEVVSGVLEEPCAERLSTFFRQLRKSK